MTKKTMQENQTLIAFWDKAFALSEEDQKQMLAGGGSDWKEMISAVMSDTEFQ